MNNGFAAVGYQTTERIDGPLDQAGELAVVDLSSNRGGIHVDRF